MHRGRRGKRGRSSGPAEVDDLSIDHGCAACHWSTGALPVLPVGFCAGSFKMSLTSTWVRAVGMAVLDGVRACGELLNVENV